MSRRPNLANVNLPARTSLHPEPIYGTDRDYSGSTYEVMPPSPTSDLACSTSPMWRSPCW